MGKEKDQYNVKIEVFEGPLGVLLNMIERRKLFINDISLSQIADDYIAYIQNNNIFSIDDSSDFILIASTLMLIKSKSLLPKIELSLDEERKIDDLGERLKSYQRIKELSIHIKNRFGENIIFQKKENHRKILDYVFSPDKNIKKEKMFSLVVDLIIRLPKKENKAERKVKKVISLEEVISNLSEKIRRGIKLSFNEFSKKEKAEKIEIVVNFLAMLELFKQGTIFVDQKVIFGDIDMESREVLIPHY